MADFTLRQRVAEKSASDGGHALALAFITSQVELLERLGGSDAELMEARVLRAEVLQKLGRLDASREELAKVNVSRLSATTGQGFLLIKAKLLMQGGDLRVSRAALEQLRDKLGPGNATDMQ